MRKFIMNHKWAVAGVIAGGIAGYAYWYFVGCSSGTCAITSRPLNSSVYGGLMGYLLSGVIVPKKENQKNNIT